MKCPFRIRELEYPYKKKVVFEDCYGVTCMAHTVSSKIIDGAKITTTQCKMIESGKEQKNERV